jgi:predicted phage tail protein
MTIYDELTNKYVVKEKELSKVKRSAKDKINTDKKGIESLKKEKNSFRKKLEVEKERNRLVRIDMEKELKKNLVLI